MADVWRQHPAKARSSVAPCLASQALEHLHGSQRLLPLGQRGDRFHLRKPC